MIAAEAKPLSEQVIDEIIARHPDKTGDVLSVLEEIQERHPLKYLPEETHDYVARKMGVSRSQILSVVTFYAFFNLKPQGRHTVTVCRGTACHTRGSKPLLDSLKASAGFHQDDEETGSTASFTTPDFGLTIRTVACFGQCALAPVAAIDHDIYGHVSDIKLRKLVAAIDAGERQ
ncbi:NAD(P)H-dependent oxidoreductase subunit E [Propionivibrio sp.]|uniref:NADH-quinone oxidoreductase subunit NuoE family protein n=1 Tax=Propionivibrio sp. TaxID=2212460 RepID=UPI00261F4C09|nr:NAD(P)H-dependent oxidoreductase subunit E [Propionivibrio sp.]